MSYVLQLDLISVSRRHTHYDKERGCEDVEITHEDVHRLSIVWFFSTVHMVKIYNSATVLFSNNFSPHTTGK